MEITSCYAVPGELEEWLDPADWAIFRKAVSDEWDNKIR